MKLHFYDIQNFRTNKNKAKNVCQEPSAPVAQEGAEYDSETELDAHEPTHALHQPDKFVNRKVGITNILGSLVIKRHPQQTFEYTLLMETCCEQACH